MLCSAGRDNSSNSNKTVKIKMTIMIVIIMNLIEIKEIGPATDSDMRRDVSKPALEECPLNPKPQNPKPHWLFLT